MKDLTPEEALVFALDLIDSVEDNIFDSDEWRYQEILEDCERTFAAMACNATPEGQVDTPIRRACQLYRYRLEKKPNDYELHTKSAKDIVQAVRHLAYDIAENEQRESGRME